MEKIKQYEVLSHKFIGRDSYGEHEWFTYEISFNQSLCHTGRFRGIEDGLNEYVRKEALSDSKDSLICAFKNFLLWIKLKLR